MHFALKANERDRAEVFPAFAIEGTLLLALPLAPVNPRIYPQDRTGDGDFRCRSRSQLRARSPYRVKQTAESLRESRPPSTTSAVPPLHIDTIEDRNYLAGSRQGVAPLSAPATAIRPRSLPAPRTRFSHSRAGE